MPDQWHITRNGRKHGPFSAAQLKQLAATGKLLPTDKVQKDGMDRWIAAASVKGLFPIPPKSAVPGEAARPTPPAAQVKPVVGDDRDRAVSEGSRQTQKAILVIAGGAIASLFLLVGIVTAVVLATRSDDSKSNDASSTIKGSNTPVGSKPVDDKRDAPRQVVRIDKLPSTVDGREATAKAGSRGGSTDPESQPEIPLPQFDRKMAGSAKLDFSTLDYTKGPQGEPLFEVQGVDVDPRQQTAAGPAQSGRWVAHAFRNSSGVWKHGVETHWDLKGTKVQELHWFDGKKHGTTHKWREDGTLVGEGAFKEDKPYGLTRAWHPNGQKKSEFVMIDGVIQGYSVEWDAKGNKLREYMMKDGKQHGCSVAYYPTGQRKEQATFKEGKQEGDLYSWHPNGRMASRFVVRDGRKTGKEVFWDTNGNRTLVLDWDADLSKPAPPITKGQYDSALSAII